MMMTARALLDRNPDPDEHEIREAISGQICRCTGYATIVRSVRWAATHANGADQSQPAAAPADLDVPDPATEPVPERAGSIT
jgi:carbon-monoxide dehydrogenase small subunit